MRIFPFYILLLTSLTSDAAGQESRTHIVIYYKFDEELSPTAQQSIEDETTLILADLNWRFEWRPISGSNGGYTSTDLVVVEFRGKCDSSDLPRYVPGGGRLGWAHVNNGAILPFVKVDCDQVLKVIRPRLLQFKPTEWDSVIGRAIGRVVAHELYHVFSHSSRHSASGLGQATFGANDLLGTSLRIEEPYIRPESGAPIIGETSDAKSGDEVYASSVCSECHGMQGDRKLGGRSPVDYDFRHNFLSLVKQLSNKGSKMFRTAKRQRNLWTPFTVREIQHLVNFLNELRAKPRVRTLTQTAGNN